MRTLLAILFLSAGAPAVVAAPVPTDESPSAIEARLTAARAAKTAQSVLGEKGSWTDFDKASPIIIMVEGAAPEPWTDALRRLQAAFAWKARSLKGSREYIVNIAGPTGGSVQMIHRGAAPALTGASQAELWVDDAFTYNGASEAALIDMTRWCRRGGDYRMPRACETLRKTAHDRGVWAQTAQ